VLKVPSAVPSPCQDKTRLGNLRLAKRDNLDAQSASASARPGLLGQYAIMSFKVAPCTVKLTRCACG